jgi:hypothetical protein
MKLPKNLILYHSNMIFKLDSLEFLIALHFFQYNFPMFFSKMLLNWSFHLERLPRTRVYQRSWSMSLFGIFLDIFLYLYGLLPLLLFLAFLVIEFVDVFIRPENFKVKPNFAMRFVLGLGLKV